MIMRGYGQHVVIAVVGILKIISVGVECFCQPAAVIVGIRRLRLPFSQLENS